MASLVWASLVWVAAFYFTRSEDAQPGENRAHLALAIGLLATTAISDGTAQDAIREPVVIERAIRGGLAGISALLVLPVLVRRVQVLLNRPLPATTLLIFYGMVAAVSVSYSVAQLVTAGKAFELGAGLLVVLTIATLDSPVLVLKRTIQFVIVYLGISIAVALVGFFILPEMFSAVDNRPGFILERKLGSPYAHHNGLSFASALVGAFCLALWLKPRTQANRQVLAIGMVISVAGLVLTSGRQGVVILLVVWSLILAILKPVNFALALAPGLVGVAVLFGDTLVQVFARGQNTDLLLSLSGRTHWWLSAVDAWLDQPLLGYGFGAGGRFVALERVGAGDVSSLHSGYLEALMGVGMMGMVLLLSVILLIVRYSAANFRLETEYAMLIVPLMMRSFISLGFGGWWLVDLALFALLAALADVSRRSSRVAERSRPEVDVVL